jgi:hypothetical protein
MVRRLSKGLPFVFNDLLLFPHLNIPIPHFQPRELAGHIEAQLIGYDQGIFVPPLAGLRSVVSFWDPFFQTSSPVSIFSLSFHLSFSHETV